MALAISSAGGQLQSHGWDAIRVTSSTDSVNWTNSFAVLEASDPVHERAACDPSVVNFDAGDGLVLYLFYDGNDPSWQTVMFVARSSNGPFGPFLKYTQRGIWEVNPPDPQVIVYPAQNVNGNTQYYGAGNASVVAANGKLYMWYTDDTMPYGNGSGPQDHMILRTSTDGIHWSTSIPTSVYEPVGEVKWDSSDGVFVRWIIMAPANGASCPVLSTSTDGVNWGPELTNHRTFSSLRHPCG